MLKPLLRTIPQMSGNVKLACTLADYSRVSGSDIYMCNVRSAQLIPATSQLRQVNIPASLIGSSWEYDLAKYYGAYAEIFYSDECSINTSEMQYLDRTSQQFFRVSDFEWGTSRVSYARSGCDLEFFAPIYIEGSDDIPDWFDITVKFSGRHYNFSRTLRVNIGATEKSNHLAYYLKKYGNRIDNNVTYLSKESESVVYDGIDVVHGGFTKKSDCVIKNIYKILFPEQEFDGVITHGFRRNKICCKQVIPLSFLISTDALFTDEPKLRDVMNLCTIKVSGQYVKSGAGIPLFDFSTDYDTYTSDILHMDPSMGFIIRTDGLGGNLMDAGFPSFRECRLLEHQFTNKLTTDRCRWKLKYSTDEYPYITNLSWAFSNNQDNNYKYREFPTNYTAMVGVAVSAFTKNEQTGYRSYYYNLIYPLEYQNDMLISADYGRKYINTSIYDVYNVRSVEKYENIQNNYCTNWYSITRKNIISDEDNTIPDGSWATVDADGKVYCNGILYDLRDIYGLSSDDYPAIDRFGVFAYIDTSGVGRLSKMISRYADYSFIPQSTELAEIINTSIRDNIINSCGIDGNCIFTDSSDYADDIMYDKVFTSVGYLSYDTARIGYTDEYSDDDTVIAWSYDNITPDTNKVYIEMSYVTGLDYYELNKYWSYTDIQPLCDDIISELTSSIVTSDVTDAVTKVLTARGVPESYIPAYLSVVGIAGNLVLRNPKWFSISYLSGDIYIKNSIAGGLMVDDNAYITTFDNSQLTYEVSPGVYAFNTEGYWLSRNLWMNDNDNNVTRSCNVDLGDPSYTMTQSQWKNLRWEVTTDSGESSFEKYNNSIYYKTELVNSATIDALSSDEFPEDQVPLSLDGLHIMCRSMCDIFKVMVSKRFTDVPEYEFRPQMLRDNKTSFSDDSFIRRGYLGRRYEDETTVENQKLDRNVLYVSKYNIFNLIDDYCAKKGKTEADAKRIKESVITENFYGIVPNKLYLSVWYHEVWKNLTTSERTVCTDWKDKVFLQEKVLCHTTTGLDVKYRYIPISNYYDITNFNDLITFIEYDHNREAFHFADISFNIEMSIATYGIELGFLEYGIDLGIGSWGLEFVINTHSYGASPVSPYLIDSSEIITPDNSVVLGTLVPKHLYFEHPPYFNVCIKDEYVRVDSNIWAILNAPETKGGDLPSGEDYPFHDMYLFRPLRWDEYDMKFFRPVTIDGVSYSQLDNRGIQYIGLDPSYGGDKLSDVISWANIEDIENCLTPMFDDVLAQPMTETDIYEHVHYDNIQKVRYVDYTKPDTPAITNYRYDTSEAVSMMMLNLIESGKLIDGRSSNIYYLLYRQHLRRASGLFLPDIKLWNMISTTDISKVIPTQDYEDNLGITRYHNIHVYRGSDDLVYGYYYIYITLDNTDASFNVVGYNLGDSYTSTDDTHVRLRVIKYINDVNIEDRKEYLVNNFKRLAPFLNLGMMGHLSDITGFIKPVPVSMRTLYTAVPASEGSAYKLAMVNSSQANQSVLMMRYFDSAVPHITECGTIPSVYYIKSKDVKSSLLDTGKYNLTGDSAIYKEELVSIDEFPGYRVFTTFGKDKSLVDELTGNPVTSADTSKKYNIMYSDKYYPTEWKHINDSEYIYLYPTITISGGVGLSYSDLTSREESDVVTSVFRSYLMGINPDLTDTDILFLFKRYNVEYVTDCTGLDVTGTYKVYDLTYKFTLA